MPLQRADLKVALIAGMGGAAMTGLLRTVRTELIRGADVESAYMPPGKPAIYVLWHGRLLPCAFHFRAHKLATLISRNRDGDYVTRMIERWGYKVIRGSSSRGGAAALKTITQVLEAGTPVALTPDGPRGPMQRMKEGPLHAARLTGAPLVPAAAGAVHAAYFGRWDRFLVPTPFTWAPVALDQPIHIPRDADGEELERYRKLVEERINAVTQAVDEAARAHRG
ncbi:MAG: DUF374 domain-containing protein [Gemmatimonas sp.]|nr:DUF374 domain-containing protein [Gemmatimonas sp.]